MKKLLLLVVALALLAVAAGFAYRQLVLLPELRRTVTLSLGTVDGVAWRNERVIGPWAVTRETLYCGEVSPPGSMEFRVFERLTTGVAHFYDSASGPDDGPACDEYADLVPWWWLRW